MAHQLLAAFAALTAGALDRTRLFALHQLTATLTPAARASVEAEMLAGSQLASPPRWRRKIHRLIARLDPGAVAKRRKRAKADRKIGIQSLDDGMALLTATLTAEDARAIYDRIDQIARAHGHNRGLRPGATGTDDTDRPNDPAPGPDPIDQWPIDARVESTDVVYGV